MGREGGVLGGKGGVPVPSCGISVRGLWEHRFGDTKDAVYSAAGERAAAAG